MRRIRFTFDRTFWISWLGACCCTGFVFWFTRPTITQFLFHQQQVDALLRAGENVSVGTETVNGYTQVYYEFEGKKTFITEGNFNHTNPSTEGEYVVWSKMINGAGQIQLYHLPTGLTLQLTNSRTNLNPQVNRDGQVVWESWINESWQVYLFNSLNLQRITRGRIALHPDIFGNEVVFSRKDEDGGWIAEQYSINDGSISEIRKGISAKYPSVDRDGVQFPAFYSDDESAQNLSKRAEGDRPFFSLLEKEKISAIDIQQELKNSLQLNAGQDALAKIEEMRAGENDEEFIE